MQVTEAAINFVVVFIAFNLALIYMCTYTKQRDFNKHMKRVNQSKSNAKFAETANKSLVNGKVVAGNGTVNLNPEGGVPAGIHTDGRRSSVGLPISAKIIGICFFLP